MLLPTGEHANSQHVDTKKGDGEEKPSNTKEDSVQSEDMNQDLKSFLIALLKDEEVRKAMPGFYPAAFHSNIQPSTPYFPRFSGTLPYNFAHPKMYHQHLSALQSEQAAMFSPFMNTGLRSNDYLGNTSNSAVRRSSMVPMATEIEQKSTEARHIVGATRESIPSTTHQNLAPLA